MNRTAFTLTMCLMLALLTSFGIYHKYPNFFARPITLVPGNSYSKEWKRVDSLAAKGLNKSALDLVKLIYGKAKKEENHPQIVKAILHRMRFESYMEEESYIKALYDLSAECKELKSPSRQIVHSITAEVYWRYYENNRWRFNQRSEVVGLKLEDIRTWDLKKFVEQSIHHYNQSLSENEMLQKISITQFYDILQHYNESKDLRPTLYDFLAHRAADFFANEEPSLTRPANTFILNDSSYFDPYNSFASINISTSDSLALKFYAIKIMQDLIRFHKGDADPAALVDADLKRLKFVYASGVADNKDKLYLLALRALENKFSSHPSYTEILYEEALYYFNNANKNAADNSYKGYKKTAMELCEKAIKAYPGSYGASFCIHLKSQIEEKELSMVVEKVNVPGKPFRALVTYKNVANLHYRIVKVNKKEYRNALEQYHDYAVVKYLTSLSSLHAWSLNMPDDKDFNRNSCEIKLPELSSGYYAVLASNSKEFDYKSSGVTAALFYVSNISYLTRSTTEGAYEFTVLHRETGFPLKGVNAEVFYSKYDYDSRRNKEIKLGTFTTDENGYFTVMAGKDYRNLRVLYQYGDDELDTDEYLYQYRYHRNKQKYVRSTIFTDRAIYRPGQTIFFKGLVLDTDGETTEIKANYPVTVTFYDVNYQKVSDLKLTTNEYGSYSGSFTAPQGVLTGQMHLTDGHGSVYVSVEEYKRPKFEVNFQPVNGSFRLNDSVSVAGKAIAFSGANIDAAKVKYRVVRNASFPYWWYYWRGYYPSSAQMEITNGETTTNDTGGYVIRFKAIPDLSVDKTSQPVFNYTVYADVTDINGETHSGTGSVRVGYTSIELDLHIPERIDRSEKLKEDLSVKSVNLNYVQEPAKVKLAVYKLKQPSVAYRARMWNKPTKHYYSKEDWNKWFPKDEYDVEADFLKWEKEKTIWVKEYQTKEKELTYLGFEEWKADDGYYMAEATCKDKFGMDVKEVKYFSVFNSKDAKLNEKAMDRFTAIKSTCEPGEKAVFSLGSSEDIMVIYEVEQRENPNSSVAKITSRQWIKINNELKTIEIPVEENNRGNFAVHFTFVKDNRCYNHNAVVTVPWTNKMLDIAFETFRDKLQPGQNEEWKIKIKGKNGDKVAAEMLATVYDASLDEFRSNNWYLSIYNSYYSSLNWSDHYNFNTAGSQLYTINWNSYPGAPTRSYDQLNWFGYYFYYNGYYGDDMYVDRAGAALEEVAMPSSGLIKVSYADEQENKPAEKKADVSKNANFEATGKAAGRKDKEVTTATTEMPAQSGEDERKENQGGGMSGIKTRKNFNETAFFFPQLETNENGEVLIKFTIPEALTKWKMMGLAHTKDLKYGQITKELVTQKELMVVPNAPRFFRENDKMEFTAKITNLSDKDLSGSSELQFFDAVSMKPLSNVISTSASLNSFNAKKGQSALVTWNLSIPEGVGALTYRVVAKAGNFTDGEEQAVPVLTNRMLVTESMPLPIRGGQTKTFTFEKFMNQNNGSSTLRNHKLTLEFTANPAWYAVQALPYLMEYPYECSEQTFSRFYANSIASHIANSSPKIKAVFDSWKNATPGNEKALLSNLEKNQELKSAILEETPWVLDAKSETERKKRVALLFDLNKMSNELEAALNKLIKAQVSNGGWPWFPGMPESRYITQHVVTGMGHLDHLGIKNVRENKKVWNMIYKAVHYLDDRINDDYRDLLRYKVDMSKNHLSYDQIQYLYARSYFMKDIELSSHNKEAFNYYKKQAEKYWLQNSRYMQGMISLALFRMDNKTVPYDIVKSLKENALHSEEMGMYWKESYEGYYWYQAPIEAHALMVEVFNEVANDEKSVDDLKVWLLKSKQTQDWKTTKATVEACYALLQRGTDWLATESNVDISLGDLKINSVNIPDLKAEAGTGYIKTSWSGSDIKTSYGKVTVSKNDKGVSWGAVYWQYFEQLDKITPHATPLNINKKLFLEKPSPTGPVITPVNDNTKLNPGDKIKVRIELRVDRDMEYVHMKDMRASCFEPLNVFSQYKYQDGLGYYESTRDVNTSFFFDYLRKGTYVFEYPLVVTHKGDFSNGITTIQCMYAPEFTSHSEGVRVNVK